MIKTHALMKVLSSQQIREWDAYTIKNEPIRSIELMERAARKCVHWIVNNYSKEHDILILLGPGNNGGDGLVIARVLKHLFYNVSTALIQFSERYSDDFRINKERLKKLSLDPIIIKNGSRLDQLMLTDDVIIIDAIFGTGLSRPADGLAREAIEWINRQNKTTISIDIPSGMFCDLDSSNRDKAIVEADHTLSFECPKLSFLSPEDGNYAGQLHILSIGLSDDYYRKAESKYYYLLREDLQGSLKGRKKFSHKGDYGHASIVAGSFGKMGAAVLATKACISTGAGLTSAHCPRSGLEILQQTVPEAMVDVNSGDYELEASFEYEKRVLGVGPGIGTAETTLEFLRDLLKNEDKAIVLDADALNIISGHKEMIKMIPKQSILTPHPKEFERLVGTWISEKEKFDKLQNLAVNNEFFVVLKGAHTAIACPDGMIKFNSTGNAGMATGGSGDVLTGILVSLLAQKYTSEEACKLGVYIHGLAADLARKKASCESVTAGQIIDHIGEAIKSLK